MLRTANSKVVIMIFHVLAHWWFFLYPLIRPTADIAAICWWYNRTIVLCHTHWRAYESDHDRILPNIPTLPEHARRADGSAERRRSELHARRRQPATRRGLPGDWRDR